MMNFQPAILYDPHVALSPTTRQCGPYEIRLKYPWRWQLLLLSLEAHGDGKGV